MSGNILIRVIRSLRQALYHGNIFLDFQRASGPNGRDGLENKEPDLAGLDTEKATIHLRLLATSDLHVHILPYDYYSGRASERLGLARTASLIERARREATNCLLFDNGDFLQGSPLGDYIARSGRLGSGDAHPILAAMNYLRYDAATLGNHEFSHGLDFLIDALAGAAFPVVSANVLLAAGQQQNTPFVPPYVLLDRQVIDQQGKAHAIKIGVIGFAPPQIMIWERHHLEGKLTTRDIIVAAKACIPRMRREGADLVIALSHSGIGADEASDGMENASTALASVAGIDAVITGHSHLVFPSGDFTSTDKRDAILGTLCGKPAVMPGFYGSHLGIIDLYLAPHSTGFTVRSHRSEARPIWRRDETGATRALVPDHAGVVSVVSKAHEAALAWASRPVGWSNTPLHSFFALVTQSPVIALVGAAQAHHVAEMLADTPFADLPVLASVAPFKAGGRGGPDNYTDVPAGEMLLRHAADLYIHPNTSAAIRMTGTEIHSWLEYAAGLYNQIQPGSQDSPLINPEFPSFNFDMICGLGFQIDLSQPGRFDMRGNLINPNSQRIRNLCYADRPLDAFASFAIATNNYRIAANSGVLSPDENRILYQSNQSNRDVLLRYLAKKFPRPDVAAPGWCFAPMPGTTVTFDSSPKALSHLADVPSLQLTAIGPTETGFMRFRLHL